MINRTVVLTMLALVALSISPVFALDCPKFPEQTKNDWEIKVGAEVSAKVAKIIPLTGAKLKTTTRRTTRDLFANIPDAGKVYLEQMMLATYCSSLRDNKTLTSNEKLERLNSYITEVRRTITDEKSAKTGSKKILDDSNKKHKEQMALLTEMRTDIQTIIDNQTKEKSSELKERFPGGFVMFGVLTDGSSTTMDKIIRTSTSGSFDVKWSNAAITEINPDRLTLQLQNLRIMRTETTLDGGTQPAGTIKINGAAVWRLDRGSKLVYINNAISFWGYALGGKVMSDTNDLLVVAIGLQRIEGQGVRH